jgi:undecaprenyl-diphosphatase
VLPIILGAVIAGAASLLSVTFLTRYFKSSTLTPFAWYCIIAGALSFVALTYY